MREQTGTVEGTTVRQLKLKHRVEVIGLDPARPARHAGLAPTH